MSLLDQLHAKTVERIEEWSKQLIHEEGVISNSMTLYKDYRSWSGARGRFPVSHGTWGHWMTLHFPKLRREGLVVYVGVKPSGHLHVNGDL